MQSLPSMEESLDDLVFTQSVMVRDLSQNGVKCPDSKGVVPWNRYVMLSLL